MTERTAGLARDRSRPPRHRYRLGVMGGTFDPIHHGHLVAASEVARRFALDEVVFVPTGRPWQKDAREVSEPEDRYLMTVIATASNPRFTVSRVDIDRPGPTYTVDTLRDLRTERGEDVDFFFITGADALSAILTWRGVEELFGLAHFVGVNRPGHELSVPPKEQVPEGRLTLMEVPALSISSTGCRDRVSEGDPIWYLVPDGIVQYIAKRGLYHDDEPDHHDQSGGAGHQTAAGVGSGLPANRLPDIERSPDIDRGGLL